MIKFCTRPLLMLAMLLLFPFNMEAEVIYIYDFEVDSVYYKILPDSITVEVTTMGYDPDWRQERYIGDTKYLRSYKGDVTIPAEVTYDGKTYKVVKIGDSCFRGCVELRSVTLPQTIDSIGEWSFAYTNITSIKLPSTLKDIGMAAFYNCKKLADINIPDSMKILREALFQFCENLKSITLPPSIYRIQGHVFSDTKIRTLDASNVKWLDSHAFCDMDSLISIKLNPTLTSIPDNCFSDCGSLEKIELPSTVRRIFDWAFDNCKKLRYINIPEGVEYISKGCFIDNESLESITIPSSVTQIAPKAFNNCLNLKKVICLPHDPPSIYEFDIFTGCPEDLKLYVYDDCLESYKFVFKRVFLIRPKFDIVGLGTTNVNRINAFDKKDAWYDLQGKRISKPGQGIYIHNGKKVLLK